MRGARRTTTAALALVLAACAGPTPSGTATSTIAPGRAASGIAGPSAAPDVTAAASQADLDAQLIDAARDNDVARARQLIGAGADVNAPDGTRQSAYLIATSEGHLELLELTLRNGADVTALDRFNGTGLIRAAERGHADIVGRLLQTDIAVDHINDLGWSALHEAIILGSYTQRYVDTVRLLVAGGADVTLPSQRDQVTPRQLADDRNYYEIATTLELALRDQDVDDPDAMLVAAAASGDADGAALAIRAGADPAARGADGRTPLEVAKHNGQADVARLLAALGAGARRR